MTNAASALLRGAAETPAGAPPADGDTIIKIRPRGANFGLAGARLAELGVTYVGFDHRRNCYADVVIPPGVEAVLSADPAIKIEWGTADDDRMPARAWSGTQREPDMREIGARLRALRIGAGLELEAAASLTGGQPSPAAVSQGEEAGDVDARPRILLAD